MLIRYQRKKFPKIDRAPLKDFTKEVVCLKYSYICLANQAQSLDAVLMILILSVAQTKQKFIIMCLIIRLSVILQRSENLDLQEVKFRESSESFKLVSYIFF